MTEKPPESEQQKTGTGMALAFGTQFAAGMAIFTAAGWWIDRQRGGGQACTLAGIFLGLFYGGYELWKVVRVLQREESKPKDDGQKK